MVSMAMASERATTTFMLSTSVSEWSSGTPLRRVSRRFCKGGEGEGRGGERRGGRGGKKSMKEGREREKWEVSMRGQTRTRRGRRQEEEDKGGDLDGKVCVWYRGS